MEEDFKPCALTAQQEMWAFSHYPDYLMLSGYAQSEYEQCYWDSQI